MAPTWPSIIPLGPTTWVRRRPPGPGPSAGRPRSVASLSTDPSAASTPQCPWSVNSSRHRSAMTTVASPTSATTSRIAVLSTPSGSTAPRPMASRDAGTPNSISPADASLDSFERSLAQACRGCAGRRRASTGSLGPRLRPPARTTAAPGARGSTEVSATSRRIAGVRRSRRGRSAGKCHVDSCCLTPCGRATPLRRLGHGLSGRNHGEPPARAEFRQRARPARRPTAPAASTSTRRPCSSAVFAVAGPMHATTVDECGLPAMPTRLRTVDDDVKTTASNFPLLIASRVSTAGGAARTVR